MQIISRRTNESIVVDGKTTVTIVAIGPDEVTLEITDGDGDTRRIQLSCERVHAADPDVASLELVCS